MPCPYSTASRRGSPRAGPRPTAVPSPGPGDSHGYPHRAGRPSGEAHRGRPELRRPCGPAQTPGTPKPQIFLKAPSAVIGNGQAIVLPAESAPVEHEAELAVVIGQTMRRVTAHGALEGIAGYCCANDVTARDVQHFDPITHA
ncbi:fumarylacetoacetate hydrolase family protein [Streptomyces sp. NPDC059161]|uniref:fumarylacetoacetate hydrolase family protein n=1 Tax=Streptomyces sp. NPDC059161 TaxID=3346749 RepID=UPI0036C2BDCE